MAKKLTLSIDEHVIEAAKDYANSQGISLSNLIENFLKGRTGVLGQKEKPPEKSVSNTPLVDKIRQIQKRKKSPEQIKMFEKELYKRKPHMKEYATYLEEKYR